MCAVKRRKGWWRGARDLSPAGIGDMQKWMLLCWRKGLVLTGLGNQSRHTLLGLHCGFCEKKQAKWYRRFRIRQFKSCWGLQSGTWVPGAEEYRGSFKEVYSEYVLFGWKGFSQGSCPWKKLSHQSARPQVSQYQRYRKWTHLWIWNAKTLSCPNCAGNRLRNHRTDPRKCSTWTPAPETLNQDVWGST